VPDTIGPYRFCGCFGPLHLRCRWAAATPLKPVAWDNHQRRLSLISRTGISDECSPRWTTGRIVCAGDALAFVLFGEPGGLVVFADAVQGLEEVGDQNVEAVGLGLGGEEPFVVGDCPVAAPLAEQFVPAPVVAAVPVVFPFR